MIPGAPFAATNPRGPVGGGLGAGHDLEGVVASQAVKLQEVPDVGPRGSVEEPMERERGIGGIPAPAKRVMSRPLHVFHAWLVGDDFDKTS